MWRNARWPSSSGWLREHNDALRDRDAEGRLLRARPLQPAPLDRGGDRLPRQRRPRGGAARPRALRLLRPLRRRPAGLRVRAGIVGAGAVRAGGVHQLVELQARRAGYARRRRPHRRGRGSSTPSRTRGWCRRRGVLPGDVPRRRRRGTCATGTWPTRSTRSSTISRRSAAGRRRSSCGRTTRTSATPAPPRWRRPGAQRRPARARAARRRTLAGRLHHLPGTVTAADDWGGRPSASACAARCRAATRSCSTSAGRRRFWCSSAAASCCGPRLERAIGVIYRPETERAEPLLPRPAAPTSSTR